MNKPKDAAEVIRIIVRGWFEKLDRDGLTTGQVATVLDVSEASVKRWCDSGKLTSVRGGAWSRRMRAEEVVRFAGTRPEAVVKESEFEPTTTRVVVETPGNTGHQPPGKVENFEAQVLGRGSVNLCELPRGPDARCPNCGGTVHTFRVIEPLAAFCTGCGLMWRRVTFAHDLHRNVTGVEMLGEPMLEEPYLVEGRPGGEPVSAGGVEVR